MNTNREIASQAFYCHFEFVRRIAMGKETKCNTQVDDALSEMNTRPYVIWNYINLELQLFEPGDIHSLN